MIELNEFIRWYNTNYDAIVNLRNAGEAPLEAGLRIYEERLLTPKKPFSALHEASKKAYEELKPLREDVNPATSKEPTPKGSGTDIVDLVKDDIEARAVVGEQSYGERLKAFNGRSGLTDAYQEVVDLTVYLRQVLEERKKIKELVDSISGTLYNEIQPYFGTGSRAEEQLTKVFASLTEIKSLIK